MRMNLKDNKGISLIVLIIIIVVLLLLVGVLVIVFNKKSPSSRTDEAIIEDASITNKNNTSKGWVYNSETRKYERNNESYAFGDILTSEQVLKALGLKNSKGSYTGTWTVIGLDGNKLKLVSTENVTDVILGYEDEIANNKKTSDEYKSMSLEEKYERTIVSYQRAEKTLDESAQTATGITVARSVNLQDIFDIIGEDNIDKGNNYGKIYKYYYDETSRRVVSIYSEDGKNNWSEPSWSTSGRMKLVDESGKNVLVDSSGNTVILKNTSLRYTPSISLGEPYERIAKYSSDGLTSWLSTKYVECDSVGVRYGMEVMYGGNIRNFKFFI